MPGAPDGKPAGVRCLHLIDDERCRLWGQPERPAVCQGLRPGPEMCGDSRAEAMATIARWERQTAPAGGSVQLPVVR